MRSDLRIEKADVLFYLAIFFEMLAMIISLSTIPYAFGESLFNLLEKGLRYMGYLLIVIEILVVRFSKKEVILLMVTVIVTAMNIPYCGRALFLMFLFIYGVRAISFDRLCKFMCVVMCSLTLLIVIMSLIGIIPNWGYGIYSERPRYSLGFFYPSHATSLFLYTGILLCYVLKEKLKLWLVIVLEILNIVQFKFTDSKTGTAVLGIAIIVFYLAKTIRKEKIKKVVCGICVGIFPLCAILSITGSLLYNASSKFWQMLDGFFTNRLHLAHDAINNYGVTLFGQKIEWVGYGGLGHSVVVLKDEYNYVDCSYVRLLLDNGILVFILVLVGFTLACWIAYKNRNVFLSLALAFVALYSIVEPRLCEIGFNPFFLVLGVLIDSKGLFLKEINLKYRLKHRLKI